MIGIYKITSPSGKIYIGSSNNIEWRRYKYANSHCKGQTKLYNSFLKYGFNKHIFEILEECEFKKLYSLERSWGLFYNVLSKNGLNCQLPGYGEIKGLMSEETKLKISLKVKGRKNTKEQYEAQSKRQLGRKMSESFCKRASERMLGTKRTAESVEKTKLGSIGIKRTKEHMEKVFNSTRKPVLDTSTGVVHKSLKDASVFLNRDVKYLGKMLCGKRPNNTNLIYINKNETN